eukprot:2933017-Rhodomonas_salina.1
MPPQKRAVVSGTDKKPECMEPHSKRPKHSPRKGKGKASSLHAVGGIGVEKVKMGKKRKKGKKGKVGKKRGRLDSEEEEEGSSEEADDEEEEDADDK